MTILKSSLRHMGAILCCLMIFAFTNHCYIEEACASFGQIFNAEHPVHTGSDDHHDSESHEHGRPCPLLIANLSKSILQVELLSKLLDFKLPALLLAFAFCLQSVRRQEKIIAVYNFEVRFFKRLIRSLSIASQAPPSAITA